MVSNKSLAACDLSRACSYQCGMPGSGRSFCYNEKGVHSASKTSHRVSMPVRSTRTSVPIGKLKGYTRFESEAEVTG